MKTVIFELQAPQPQTLMWNLGHESYFGTAHISPLCVRALEQREAYIQFSVIQLLHDRHPIRALVM